LKKAFSEKKKYDSIIPLESNNISSMSSISSEDDDKECSSLISSESSEYKILKSMTKKVDYNKEEEKVNDDKNESELYSVIKNREKTSFHGLVQRAHNEKFGKFIRANKRTKTSKKNVNQIFDEYYNGQYDETIYLYAGIGTLVSENMKKLYHGTFRYGKKEGFGMIYFLKDDNNIEYYMGEIRQNKREGYGIRIRINNIEFNFQEGNFISDNFIGGKYLIIKKKNEEVTTIKYVGDIKDNKFAGEGILTEKKYKEKEGKYVLIQKKEYNGQFLNGQKSGKGKETFNNILDQNKNYEYEGKFSNGLKDGYGKIEYDASNFVQKYEGFFKKDKPFQIYGIINFKSGDTYEGFFENNGKEDLGLYSFYNIQPKQIIEQYFGGFLGDCKNGIGKTLLEESEVKMLLGPYKQGEKDGQFEKIIYINAVVEVKKRNHKFSLERRIYEHQKRQIKSYPVYQENQIIDINDNYYYNEFLDT
jgi:hypothetical protein